MEPFGAGIVISTGLSFEKYSVFVTFAKQDKKDKIKRTVISTKNALKLNVCKNENRPNFTISENKR